MNLENYVSICALQGDLDQVLIWLISLVLLVERYQIVKYLENNCVPENIYLLSFVALALIMLRAIYFLKKYF